MAHNYETNGPAIYQRSFAMIRSEAQLARFSVEDEPIVVRMIHALGHVPLAEDILLSPDFGAAARGALRAGAPILCDAQMVAAGITRKRLPADNEVVCTLRHSEVPELAARSGTTRSAAALELWRPIIRGAVVAIGNAPTALFRLLELLESGECGTPAAIVGCPVGFVGAAESKAALSQSAPAPYCVVRGRLGGSAVTSAAINALACEAE